MIQPTNKLAIVLLSTVREYELGLVEKCLDAYLNHSVSQQYCFDFFIYFNQLAADNFNNLYHFKHHSNIQNFFIKNYNYSEAEDIYLRTPSEVRRGWSKKAHPLGASGGANLLFFDTMLGLIGRDYKNYLMIESDSRPVTPYWYDGLINNISSLNFLICGSRYKGAQELPRYESWTGHLNGIAVYKNNIHTQKLLSESRKYIEYSVNNNLNNFISFDVGIWHYSNTLAWQKYQNLHDVPKPSLIDCNFISNYSLYADVSMSTEMVLHQQPETIILHQKWN